MVRASTRNDHLILSLHMKTTFHLSGKAFNVLLLLLRTLLPGNNIPRNFQALKRIFVNIFPKSTPSVHKFCSTCHTTLSSTRISGLCYQCGSIATPGRFITTALDMQLKKLLEGQCYGSASTVLYIHVSPFLTSWDMESTAAALSAPPWRWRDWRYIWRWWIPEA